MENHPLDNAINATATGCYVPAIRRIPEGIERDACALRHLVVQCGALSTYRAPYVLTNTLFAVASISHDWLRVLGVERPWDAMRTEYDRAKAKHGDMTLDNPEMSEPLKYFTLIEEVGEVARALTYDREHAGGLIEEITQVGGLALAWATARTARRGARTGA